MNNEYITVDLNIAAAIITMGVDIKNIDKTNRNRVKFVFENSDKVIKIETDYFNDKLKVPVLKYVNTQKLLKDRVYN